MASSDGVPARRCRPLRGSALPAWSGAGALAVVPTAQRHLQRQARHQVSQGGVGRQAFGASSQRNQARPSLATRPLRLQQTDRCVTRLGRGARRQLAQAQRRQLPQIRPLPRFASQGPGAAGASSSPRSAASLRRRRHAPAARHPQRSRRRRAHRPGDPRRPPTQGPCTNTTSPGRKPGDAAPTSSSAPGSGATAGGRCPADLVAPPTAPANRPR